ncbi:protein ERGIC-53 isoform X2 [Nelusetta ayraudi]|uniref:protein ERGIC-53 isoform X2 n=1 Tax=Nelusetta ayraudi TaxID=303726 RepID=UPI003F71F543
MAVSIERRPAASARPVFFLLLAAFAFLRGVAADGPASEETPHRRFEYKYSFKGPHLAQSDGGIPFWIHTGNAIPSADQVRITPSLRSQRGSVWTKNKINFEHWEAEVTFRVSGRGRMGADGLAMWFTAEQGLDGPVYGAADQWNGIGVFFDSFDNDGKKNNPAILVVGNNGKLVYDHQNDGTTQSLGTCLRDFRNKPYPIRAKITYYKKTLTVLINNGFTPDKEDYEFCTKVDNMVIPPEGFLGISAATGGLADDHDVLSFLVFRLTEPGQQPPPPESEIPKEEKDKYQEEFQNFQQELDKKKEEFQKEHPDVQGQPIEDLFESVNDREIRQVFEGQTQIHLEIKQLHRQLAMILDEQRRYVALITEEVTKKGTAVESGQELLPRVAEADRLGAAAPAAGRGGRHGDVRDHPALQRHQGASSPGQEGRGEPGPAQRTESCREGGEVPRGSPDAFLLVHHAFHNLRRGPVGALLLLHHVQESTGSSGKEVLLIVSNARVRL